MIKKRPLVYRTAIRNASVAVRIENLAVDNQAMAVEKCNEFGRKNLTFLHRMKVNFGQLVL